MDKIKLKKPIDEIRHVLKHYLNNGHKFTDTPPSDPRLATMRFKFEKWSADAAGRSASVEGNKNTSSI